MNRRVLAAALFLLMPAFAAAQDEQPKRLFWEAEENIGLGLFQSVSLSPFPSLRTGLGPRLPSSLQSGAFEFRINEDWARMLSVQDDWLLDYDVLRSNLGLSWGVTDRLRLDLDFETATRTSGYLDTFILGFHRTFNLSIGERRQYQNHPQTFSIQPPEGGATILVDEHDPQPYAQSLVATAQYALVRGGASFPDVSASVSLRRVLNNGDLSLGSPVDVGGSLSFSKSAGPVYFYLGGSIAWYGEEDFSGLPLRSTQWSGIFGIELRGTDWFSVTAQYLITSGGVDSFDDLSRPSHEVTAGFKWKLGRAYVLETAILENIVNPYNSPDFGVHFSFTVRW